MSYFPILKKKENFLLLRPTTANGEAIQEAEKNTSGEVRVFVERKCKYVDPVDRAKEIFFNLKMDKTKDRNAVLLYIAMDDHQVGTICR